MIVLIINMILAQWAKTDVIECFSQENCQFFCWIDDVAPVQRKRKDSLSSNSSEHFQQVKFVRQDSSKNETVKVFKVYSNRIIASFPIWSKTSQKEKIQKTFAKRMKNKLFIVIAKRQKNANRMKNKLFIYRKCFFLNSSASCLDKPVDSEIFNKKKLKQNHQPQWIELDQNWFVFLNKCTFPNQTVFSHTLLDREKPNKSSTTKEV